MTTNKVAISAVIISKNGGEYLDQVLASVAVCNDIILLDSGSTDDTIAIARRHGARVEHQDFLGFGAQKRLAVKKALNDWVFSIDCDEILDEKAQRALLDFKPTQANSQTCYTILRRNMVGETEIRFGDWAPDLPIRLFNRTATQFADVPIHEAVVSTGVLQQLPGSMIHHSYRDLADVFRLDYHRLKGERYRTVGRKAGGATLAIRAVGNFMRSYLIRGGWRDGSAGVIVALSVALNATLGLALASAPAAKQAATNT